MPTQADLQEASDKLSSVRKNRNSLAVFIVLLLGMLGGAGAVIFLLLGSSTSSSGAEGQRLGQLETERTAVLETLGADPALPAGQLNNAVSTLARERNDVIQALRIEPAPAIGQLDEAARAAYDASANNTRVVDELRPLERYETIHRLRVQAGTLRAEIKALTDDPLRANMPANISNGLVYYKDGLPRAWAETKASRTDAELATSWEQFMEDSLEKLVMGLEAEKASILEWAPQPAGAGPVRVPQGEVVLP